MSVLQNLIALLILKAAPQDLPYSTQLAVKLIAGYVFSGIIVLQTTVNPDDLIQGMLLGLLIQLVFTYAVLRALGRSERFVQTLSAIIGVGVLFNFIAWPVLSMLNDVTASDTMRSSLSLVFLMVMSWEVLVKAHIYKHALEMKMFSALALSFSLFFISIALSQLFFPAASS